MNLQNCLLCILYTFLIIVHAYTLCRKNFHRSLISIFSFALIMQTISTMMFTIYQTIKSYGKHLTDLSDIDLSPLYNIQYFAQLIHIISINFFILFLLIVAKGWPITRRDMPFKYAFAIFWLICLAADLITFYWTTITVLAKHLGANLNVTDISNSTTTLTTTASTTLLESTSVRPINSIIESLPNDTEQFNSTPRRLRLLLRIVIMVYFLLELRTTMILEQEQKKLQFYLHFGALSMVWFVHSVIVYVISLRVEIVWQSKLIDGFSSAANFLAFAITTRLLWPKSSRSYLFRKHKRNQSGIVNDQDAEVDGLSIRNNNDDDYDGLEMRDLSIKPT